MRLEDRTAIVSGSGRGIGREIALKLASEGARIVVNDLDAQPAAETVAAITSAGGTAVACVGSVTDPGFADRFVEAFGNTDAESFLSQRSSGAAVGGTSPLSVYVHIPFCESVCYYCACNKVITKHHDRAAEYLDALDTEIRRGRRRRTPENGEAHDDRSAG